MAFPQIDTPNAGPLTAADLDRSINTGRIYHLHRATQYEPWRDTVQTQPGKLAPAGCDNSGRYPARQLPAEACSELLEDDPCRPPFSLVGIVLILCTGIPFLAVIGWALLAWLPGA